MERLFQVQLYPGLSILSPKLIITRQVSLHWIRWFNNTLTKKLMSWFRGVRESRRIGVKIFLIATLVFSSSSVMPSPMSIFRRLTITSIQMYMTAATSEWSYTSPKGGNQIQSLLVSPNSYAMQMVFLSERLVITLYWIHICTRLNTRTSRILTCPPTWLHKIFYRRYTKR